MGVLGQVECHQPVQGIPLALVVLVKSPISWSQDNNIAIVTQHGTYIFDLYITPEECSPGLMFNRNFIAPPNEEYKVDTGVNIGTLLDHSERSDAHNLMLDDVLSSMQRAKIELDPKHSKTTTPAMPGGDPNHVGYRRGAWSPRGVAQKERCMICLVTHDHQVFLVARQRLSWKETINISKLWKSYVTANDWAILEMKWNTPAYKKHVTCIKMLAVAEILWTPLLDADTSDGFSVLIMCLANGRVVFWRVPANLDPQDPEIEEAIEIMSVKDFKLENISSMHWLQGEGHSGVITVGNCHGQVKMFEVLFHERKVSVKDYGFAYEDEDNLNVNHIHVSHIEEGEVRPHDNGQFLIVIAKHNILLAMIIKITNGAISVQDTSFKHVAKFAITGLVFISPAYIYISVKDGALHHASVNINDKDKCSIVVHEPVFQSEGSAYTGFMISPNKTLWGILESISVAYDHLIVREPTQINFYQVGKPTTVLSHLRKSTLPLYQNLDVLESLRISLLKCEDVDLPLLSVEEILKLPINQQKLEYWLLRMFRAVGYNKNKAKDMETSENLISSSIIEDNAISTLQIYAGRGKIPAESSLSLSLMCKWLKQQDKHKELTKSILQKLKGTEMEKCLVCKKTVELSSVTMDTCSQGHRIPRCPLTLLLTKPNAQCPRCRIFIHEQQKCPESEVMSRCLFCNGLVLQLTKRRKGK